MAQNRHPTVPGPQPSFHHARIRPNRPPPLGGNFRFFPESSVRNGPTADYRSMADPRRFCSEEIPMKRLLCPVAVLLFSVTARTALAALLTPGTLADYINLGSEGGQIDDKLFYDFTYSGTGLGGAVAIPASAIAVTPVNTAFNPGLQFSAPWSVGPGEALDSFISYKVLVLPGGVPITDISAAMTSSVTFDQNGFTAGAVENVFTGEPPTHLLSLNHAFEFDQRTLAPTMGPVIVGTEIFLVALEPDGQAFVVSATNQFSETIPEPSTLLIWSVLGSLAVAAGWWRRRR